MAEADTSAMVASAVVIPEELEQTLSITPTGATKRRQSASPEGDNKRTRLSDQDASESVSDSKAELPSHSVEQASDTVRRKSQVGGRDAEKQRGKRLFGHLIGTISQSSSSTAQKRRAEIEKRQRDRLREQADVDEETKKQNYEQLMIARFEEQKVFDRETMRIRHANSLSMSRFLYTTAEPKLYYRPWDLLKHQRDKVDAQIQGVEAEIELELLRLDPEFRQQKTNKQDQSSLPANKTQLLGVNDRSPIMHETTTVGSPKAMDEVPDIMGEVAENEDEVHNNVGESITNPATDNATGLPDDKQEKEAVEENEDAVVVEAGEDPVIY